MPELPEVETVVRQLAPHLRGRTVRAARIYDSRFPTRGRLKARGSQIKMVTRRGKHVVIELRLAKHPACLLLVVHLGMNGCLIWSDGQGRMPRRHLRAEVLLDGGRLLFYDPRRFGRFFLAPPGEEDLPTGREPLAAGFTARSLEVLLASSRQELKPWLMRQDRLVGIGNIYASEILFASRLDPRRRVDTLRRPEVKSLHAAIRWTLRRAIDHCGTTVSDYQDARGRSGGFQRFLRVYGREGKPCRRCGSFVDNIVQQGRSTFFCPICQR